MFLVQLHVRSMYAFFGAKIHLLWASIFDLTLGMQDLVKFVLSRKVLLDEVQENSSDVNGGVVVERGVEPDDFSLLVIPHSVFWDWFMLEIVVVSGSF